MILFISYDVIEMIKHEWMDEWEMDVEEWKRTECIYTLLCIKYVTNESLLYSTRGEGPVCETDHQAEFDASIRVLKASALGQPRGMGWGRWAVGFRMGTHVHPWLIHVSRSVQLLSRVRLSASPWTAACHVNVWQKPPQYCKAISLQLK